MLHALVMPEYFLTFRFVTSCMRRFRIWMEPFPPLQRRTAAFKLHSHKPRRVSMSSTQTNRGGKRSFLSDFSLPTTSVLSYANLKRTSERSRSDITTRYGNHHTLSGIQRSSV